MLQIARGMEYLHSKKIYHGDLNPFNVLIKARNTGPDVYLLAKVSGFGLSSSVTQKNPTNGAPPHFIWYAPEVLAEHDQKYENGTTSAKYSEKADVYNFGMICFELVKGKVPFEDTHLQGDKTARNIRAGERPLFPFHSPKCVTNLTKRCWQADPAGRPSFALVCRVLRYTKRFLAMNPEHGQGDGGVDLSTEVEGRGLCYGNGGVMWVPYEMFAYRVGEREKARERETSESGSDGGDERADDHFMSPTSRMSPETTLRKLSLSSRKSLEIKQPGTPKGRSSSVRPPHTPGGRGMRMSSEKDLLSLSVSPKTRRRSGPASDSELP
ncbi:Protein kinase superfamily protein [Striga hermonthica]|uniref:Protein kinase superfamily protein n=1 Tax=Striga hermonthica TaxID=68872 RepID=A0A9N7R8W7_STRHE|nr:Protein kinase superfamily protein [Striga hermonthica]